MAEELVRTVLDRASDLMSSRSVWDEHWQEIAERILPRQAEFNTVRTPGEKRTQKIYEAQPALALERFASAMEAMLTPRGSKWHRLRFPVHELNERQSVKEWFDAVNEVLFRTRYRASANFASQQHENYMGLGAFGTAMKWIGEDEIGFPTYKSLPLAQTSIAENHHGRVDTLFRKYRMAARNIPKRFPEAESLPEKVEKAKPDETFTVIHAIFPREERDPNKIDAKNMEFASVYVLQEEEFLLLESGEPEWPSPVSRYVTAPSEIYGRSPAMTVLPDIKMINEMAKEVIVSTHLRNRPPLASWKDGSLKKVMLKPGYNNRGAIDKEGRQLVKPLELGADPQVGDIGIERRLNTINDAFLVNLMRVLTEHPDMTATQALMLAQERNTVMGPTMGRQQAEDLGVMIHRELEILRRNGHIPEPPPEVQEAINEGADAYEIEYDAPINRAQKADDGMAIQRAIESVIPLAEIRPEIMDHYDTDEIARMMPDIWGAPAKILRELEEVTDIRGERAEQMAAMQMAEAAPGLAKAAKDGAQAQQIAQESQ